MPFEAAYKAGMAMSFIVATAAQENVSCRTFSLARMRRSLPSLLTRDPNSYRAYFPDLDIISPETHP